MASDHDIADVFVQSEAERKIAEFFAKDLQDGFAYCKAVTDKNGKPIDYIYIYANDAYVKITGSKREVVLGKRATELFPTLVNDPEDWINRYGTVAITGEPVRFEALLQFRNVWYSLFVYSPKKGYFAVLFDDITERKKAEAESRIMLEFLKVANVTTNNFELVKWTLDFFQKQCGCEAVGVRLKEGDDYPYYETRGFPPEHVQLENKLCARDDAGCVIRDSKGQPVIECMCGNVMCGRFDPSKKFFTERGSFWTNSTTQLLASTTDADRQARTRNRCNGEGYESVALLPLQVGDTRYGLLQLNDKRKEMFTLEMIQMWERIADRLALALSRNIADEALKKQALLIDLSPDAIIVKKVDETITFWSGGAEKLYGYSKQKALGQKINTLLKAKHSQSSDEIISQLKRDKNWIGEITRRTKNGDEVTVQSNWSATLNAQGEIVEILESNVDITDRKRAELALRESERRYRTLFSNMEEGFFLGEPILDRKGTPVDYRILEANSAFEKQSGLKITDLVGKTIKEVLPGLEESWVQTYCKVAITGEPVHFENYNSDTQRYYEVYSFSPSYGRFASLFIDITERNRMQNKLKEYGENLEKLVEERTRQLKDSERMAAIGQTAAMVGHDIRNPLQAIVSELFLARQVMIEEPKNADKKEVLESIDLIHEQVDYINKIVSDLQDYARPLNPEYAVVDIEDLLVKVFETIALPDKVTLKVDVKDPVKLKTDATFIQRALTNLVNNAIQAMPDGGELGLSAQRKEDCIVICVSDTGQGIPEHVKANLFKPLTTTKSKGQGLGLAVVKRLVEGLNGKVSFESEEGKGTKFIIELPAQS